jgi:AAA+ ATPase superfamily predicted ATPase
MAGFTLQPATGDTFVGRERLITEMVADLGDISTTSGYALYGKRRIGKTSILLETSRILSENERIVPVYFSVWSLIENTVWEFCRMFCSAILDSYLPHTSLRSRAADLLQLPLTVLRELLDSAEFRFIYHDLEFLLTFRKGVQEEELLDKTFSLAERLAQKTGTKCVLMIDEFPSITDLKLDKARIGEQIVRKLRTSQEIWKHTSLCVSGSIRSTMDLTVLSAGSPFYRQLISREIGPLSFEEVEELYSRILKLEKRDVEEIYRFSGGIPFYVQFLGKNLLREKDILSGTVTGIEKQFLQEEGNLLFRAEFTALSPKERLLVLELARGHNTPKALASVHGDKVSNINRFLMYLEAKGVAHRVNRGVYALQDPVFERWLQLQEV